MRDSTQPADHNRRPKPPHGSISSHLNSPDPLLRPGPMPHARHQA